MKDSEEQELAIINGDMLKSNINQDINNSNSKNVHNNCKRTLHNKRPTPVINEHPK